MRMHTIHNNHIAARCRRRHPAAARTRGRGRGQARVEVRRELAGQRRREKDARAAKGAQDALREERGRLGELAQVRGAGVVVVCGEGAGEVGEGGKKGVVVEDGEPVDTFLFCLLFFFVVVLVIIILVVSSIIVKREKSVGEVHLFQHVAYHQRVRLLRCNSMARLLPTAATAAHNLQPHPCVGIGRFEGGDGQVGDVVVVVVVVVFVGQHADEHGARVGEPVGKGRPGGLEAVEAGRHAKHEVRVLTVAWRVGRRDGELNKFTGRWSHGRLVAEIVDVEEVGAVCEQWGGGVGDIVSIHGGVVLGPNAPSCVFDFPSEA